MEQQQQVMVRKQEQAMAAREALQQLKAAPEPTQQISHLILQQNQPLYLARVLQVTHALWFICHDSTAMTPFATQIHAEIAQQRHDMHQTCRGRHASMIPLEKQKPSRSAAMSDSLFHLTILIAGYRSCHGPTAFQSECIKQTMCMARQSLHELKV